MTRFFSPALRLRRGLPIMAACISAIGCDRGDSARFAVQDVALLSHFAPAAPHATVAVKRMFGLEENALVINVSPEATLDPAGGFLVTDEREAQIRRYAARREAVVARGTARRRARRVQGAHRGGA